MFNVLYLTFVTCFLIGKYHPQIYIKIVVLFDDSCFFVIFALFFMLAL